MYSFLAMGLNTTGCIWRLDLWTVRTGRTEKENCAL